MSQRRVVVTGLGAITPIGETVASMWASVGLGKHGFGPITRFDTENFKVKLAAEVSGFAPEKYLEKKEYGRMDRFCQFAMVAAQEAMQDANLPLDTMDKTRFGVMVGSGIGGMETFEKDCMRLFEKGPSRVSFLMVPMLIGNMAAGNIAIKYGAKGTCSAVQTACSTSANAIGDAAQWIKSGMADVMIAGGAEASITAIGVAGFTQLTALSQQTDPDRASIPFDLRRDGFVMGEGAGILVLEELTHALARGATIYGEVAGYGSTCDAYHMTAPDPEGDGAARAMQMAMNIGGVAPEDVSYINAHGTSTQPNEKAETLAIKRAFGDLAYQIPISSTKSMTGHMLGAAGAIEAIMCLKSMQDDLVPQTLGLLEDDPACDLDYVKGSNRHMPLTHCLTNSMGFGGHCATLLLSKMKENK